MSWLREAFADIPEVSETRGRGLMIGVDLRDPATGAPLKGSASRVAAMALKAGILVLPAGAAGNVVELSPPLTITEEQLAWAVPHLARTVRGVVSGREL